MKNKKVNSMDVILIFMGAVLLIYTGVVLYLFSRTGCEPSTLTISIFGLMTGECGFMSWIKTTKEREWRKEDEKEYRELAEKEAKTNEHN